jgi:tetratricopeptide (TPR) repeat protein
MNTQLRAWSLGVLEAATLVALTTVPLLVNFYGFRVFDLPKAALLVALALVAALFGVVALVERRPGDWRGALGRPVVAAALFSWLATVIATVFSIVPRLSLFGSGERAQGLITLSAALVLFGAVAVTARERARRARIVAALIAGSVPVAVFALLQALGAQVVAGTVESTTRVFGTLSNPIFLGAYLMLVVPLTWARLVAAWGGRRIVLTGGLALVLLAQLGALLASQSRGPLVGLAAGAIVFALAWSAAGGRRAWGWSAVVLSLVGITVVVVLNLPGAGLDPVRRLPIVGRFAQITQTESGSQATRLRIWEAVDRLVASESPRQLVVGNGPEALKYALLPHTGANIAGRAQADRLVDRAHNALLDALVMTGLLGALALLLVHGAWFLTAATALGIADDARARRTLVALLAAGALLGALARLVPALRVHAGALVLLGMVAALAVFLVLAVARRRDAAIVDLVPVALLAAGAAAVAEAAFGIQTVVTQVVFWVLAGLVVAGRDAEPVEAPAPVAARPRHEAPREQGTVTLSWSAGGAALGLATGAAMGLAIYDLLLRGTPRLPDTVAVTILLVAAAWLAGLLAASDAGESTTAAGVTALAAFAVYLPLRAVVPAVTGDAAALWGATLVFLIALVLLGGWWIRARASRAGATSGAVAIAYPILAIPMVAALYVLSVRPVTADVYFQAAATNFDAALQSDDTARFGFAEDLFQRAVALNPTEDSYHLQWGERYTLVGGLAGDPVKAAPWFQKAQSEVVRAEQLDPRMPYHTFNRGHLQLVFAQMVTDPQQRVTVAQNAETALQQAFDKLPSDPQVANELALARLLQGDEERVKKAVSVLEYVRDHLDPQNATTYQLLGRAYAAAGRTADAQAAVERAIALGAGSAEDLVTLGDLARQADDLPTAIKYYEQAVNKGDATWAVLFNLGLLYRDTGDVDKAMNALSQALQRAPAEEQARVQAAIEALLTSGTGVPTPGG